MNGVSAPGGRPAIGPALATHAAPAGATGSPLLPEPLAQTSVEDLYAVFVEVNAAETEANTGRVRQAQTRQKQAIQEQREALARAEEEKKGGFLSFLGPIGKLFAAAATAVAVVCTAGAGLTAVVGVGVAMSAGGFVVGETRCLDAIFGKGASAWIGAGLSLAGTAMTFGATTSPHGIADGMAAASEVAKGAHRIDDAAHRHAADGAMLDAKEAKHRVERMQRGIENLLSLLEDAKDASRRTRATVDDVVQTQGATLLVAAGGRA